MTVQQPNNPGDFVALRADRGSVANLQGVAAVVPRDGLTDGSASAAADLSNVVAFARARRVRELVALERTHRDRDDLPTVDLAIGIEARRLDPFLQYAA